MLKVEDVVDYFPNTPLNELEIQLNNAIIIAQSSIGANRSLTKGECIEMKSLPQTGVVYFSKMPIWENSTNTPIQIQLKDSHNHSWQKVESFEIDYSLGFVDFTNYLRKNCDFRFYSYQRQYLSNMRRNQIRLSYYSGFDFSTPILSEDALKIKNTLIALIKLRQNPQYEQGMKKFKLDRHYEVEYLSNSDTLGIRDANNQILNEMDVLLRVFREFRPRVFSS